MKKMIFISIILLFFSFSISKAQQACLARTAAHIRLVGDSWAHFPAIYAAYDSALAKYGFADYSTVSDGSVLISMTAETWWQNPLARFALETSLNTDAVRPIDIIIVSLGGNDVAFGIRKNDSLNVLDDNLFQARMYMDSIFDFIHAKYPNGQIIWQSYDYPNFNDPCLNLPWNPYCDLWNGRGNPSPYEINRFMAYMTDFQDTVVQGYRSRGKEYMHFYNNLGLMQWRYGQLTPLRFDPFDTYPPRTVPLPYGNMYYPSPLPAMGLLQNDTYHLSPQGYTYLAEAYMRQFISNYFRKGRDTSIYSMGQNYDGWSDANGGSGIGEVLVGKQNPSLDTKGIFSFNTEFIPDEKVIKKASLFFKLKTIKHAYRLGLVFPQHFTLDIKSGTFGNAEIEGTDYSAVNTATDVACFAGKLIGNDYALRADLLPSALQYINKNGITQFSLSTADSNLLSFFNGDTTAFEGPYLDIYYDSISVITKINQQKIDNKMLSVFPNPTSDKITLQLDNTWLHQNILLEIYDSKGILVQTTNELNTSNEQIQLDVSQLAAGGYFISIKTDKMQSVATFIKIDE